MKTITIQFGPANQITKQVDDHMTIGGVLSNAGFRATLGYGANVQALDEDRRHLRADSYVQHGQVITIETIANQKAAGVRVTVSFGPANSVKKELPAGTTLRDIKNNQNLRATLNFGANVKALIDRVEQSDDYVVQDHDEVELETVANQKAA